MGDEFSHTVLDRSSRVKEQKIGEGFGRERRDGHVSSRGGLAESK